MKDVSWLDIIFIYLAVINIVTFFLFGVDNIYYFP